MLDLLMRITIIVGVSQLPFLKSGNGVATTENQSSSLESVLFINLPNGLPFGASFQTNFTVSFSGRLSFRYIVTEKKRIATVFYFYYLSGKYRWIHYLRSKAYTA